MERAEDYNDDGDLAEGGRTSVSPGVWDAYSSPSDPSGPLPSIFPFFKIPTLAAESWGRGRGRGGGGADP